MSLAIRILTSHHRGFPSPAPIVAAAPVPLVPTPRSLRSITRLLLPGVAIVSLACGTDGNDQQSPERAIATCAEVDRGRWTSGDEVVIADDPSPPCRLVLDTTVIRSYSPAEADSLDLETVREVDRHGNLYVQGYTPGVITVLSPTGDLVARLGREGPGPGELASGYLGVEVSERDSIYIQDNRLHWTVFGPDRRYVRTMPLGEIASGANLRCILPDGSVISSTDAQGAARGATLRLLDADGTVQREFGEPEHDAPLRSGRMDRGVTCGSGTDAWAFPNPLDPSYRLERWSKDGTLLNVITRTAPWFDAGPELTRTEAMTQKPHSAVRQVFEARAGLLYTMIVNADPRWTPITREQWEELQVRQYDVRFEALDGISGKLLAVLLVDDQRSLPNARILRDGRSYQFVVDDAGAVQLVGYTLRLVDP